MKKIVFLLFVIIFLIKSESIAQQNLNLRFGYKQATASFNEANSSFNGFNIGLNKDFKFSEKFCLRPGIYYQFQWHSSEKVGKERLELMKAAFSDFNVKESSRFRDCDNFLEIPLMAAWTKNNFDFEIGSYFSYEFATRNSFAGKKYSSEYGYQKFDIGLKIGFGYNIFGKYHVGISYENGIKNISKSRDKYDKNYTSNLSFNLGYNF